jgi:hypothetical protein
MEGIEGDERPECREDDELIAEEKRLKAQDEDEERRIHQSIEDSKNQNYENEQREERQKVIARRSIKQQQLVRGNQSEQQQRQAHPDAKASKPSAIAPKGIPSSMIVSQPDFEEGVVPFPLRMTFLFELLL